jgi:hypothetical protein
MLDGEMSLHVLAYNLKSDQHPGFQATYGGHAGLTRHQARPRLLDLVKLIDRKATTPTSPEFPKSAFSHSLGGFRPVRCRTPS